MSKLKKIIIAGLLIATSIILNRFLSIRTPITTIGISFVATTMSGMLLGPWWTMFVSGIADVIGALLFPTGAFFPGYTLTAVITGLFDGLLFNHAKDMSAKKFLVHAVIAHALVVVICSIGLNTLWTWYLTKKALAVILPTRLINAAVMLPVRIAISFGLHIMFLKTGIYKKLYSSPGDVDDTLTEMSQDETLVAETAISLQTEDAKQSSAESEQSSQKSAKNTQKSVKNSKKTSNNTKNSKKIAQKSTKNSVDTSADTTSTGGGEQ